MILPLRLAKLILAALLLVAPPVGIATHESGSARISPSPELSLRHCEQYPYTVICDKNYTAGGRVGCFDTLCDAAASGAYHCKRNASACEPH